MSSGLSRRGLLRGLGAGGAAAALSGCGIAGLGVAEITPSPSAINGYWADQTKTPGFTFANWTLYIDVTDSGDHPTLDQFTRQTGMKVKYEEVINEDESFVGQIQPVLSAGQSSGYDLMVITNGRYMTELFELGLLEPLDQTRMPNFYRHATPALQHRSYDPDNTFTMPWQSGMTGIAYNPKYVGEDITSFESLFDPKYKGKVGMFNDTEDLPNLTLVGMGYHPQETTEKQWRAAAAKLTKQRDDGIVRAYYDGGYIAALASGDIWITMGWSGDVFQENASSGGDLKFVVPEEGGLLWTDNMCIPKYASNAYDAMTYMDWVYQPSVAATMADYINYITPVEGVQQIFAEDAKTAKAKSDRSYYAELAASDLVFPTSADYQKLYSYRTLTGSQQKVWDGLFQAVYQ
jgi:spermidine/putrescine transport system substrate-binding protein